MLFLGLLVVPAVNGQFPFEGGSGTEEDPYQIANVEQLQSIWRDLTAHYVLVDDIDASETETWNLDDEFIGEKLGIGMKMEFQTYHSPILSDSENVYVRWRDWSENGVWKEKPVDKNDYEINYETGKITFDESPDELYNIEDIDSVKIDYRTIDEHPRGFDPVGQTWRNRFKGSFHGRGNVIKNLYICRPDEENVGLFGYTGDGTEFRNVRIENAKVIGNGRVGILVGMNGGEVSKVFANGNVAGFVKTGLLLGRNCGSVSSSYSTGYVEGKNWGIGGLIGINSGDATVSNCYSTGNVSGRASVGGLIGRMFRGGKVTNSYSIGEVTGGGLVGGKSSESEVSNSFWDVETSGAKTSAGGTGKSTEEMKTKSTFTEAGWDFEKFWWIIEGETYPQLRVFK